MANGNELDDQCLWTTRRQFRLDVLSTRHVPSPRYHLHRQAITFDFCEFDRFLFLRNLWFCHQRHDWKTNQIMGWKYRSQLLVCLRYWIQ
jgi:hypothetical protein